MWLYRTHDAYTKKSLIKKSGRKKSGCGSQRDNSPFVYQDRAAYSVSFDSAELIEKPKPRWTMIRITSPAVHRPNRRAISLGDLRQYAFDSLGGKIRLEYHLIGKIVEGTQLTRHTASDIQLYFLRQLVILKEFTMLLNPISQAIVWSLK